MDNRTLLKLIAERGVTQRFIAEIAGTSEDKVSKALAGKRGWRPEEKQRLEEWANHLPGENVDGDRAPVEVSEYLPIEIMPSFAGMGGGGTGDGDQRVGLVPRAFVEADLRASPSDLVLVEARGDSMSPDFLHGDLILIDKRDRNPIQPGPFALFDGDGYVIKLVERAPGKRGVYRVFSANDRYSAYELDEEEMQILGRPCWFARQL